MFIKAFSPEHFDTNGEPTSEILKISSKGLGSDNIKRANLFQKIIENYSPLSNKTAVHTIAMTSSDQYGFNRNGDGWTTESLLRDHPTFVKHAKVFRHHRNTSDDPSYGIVKASMYNEDMDRVELLLELDNEKCAEELALLEKEGSFPVSMACRIKYDVCSICDNRAKTAAEYCGHVKKSLGQILEDGRMVGVDNPNSTFFDISRVIRPADRVAYTLRKAASNSIVSGADLAQELGYSLPLDLLRDSLPKNAAERADILSKLSEMEKRIEGVMKAHSETADCDKKETEDLAKKLSYYTNSFDTDKVMRSLADNNVMLSANEYLTVMTGNPPVQKTAEDLKNALRGIYSNFAQDLEEVTKTSGYEPCDLPVTGNIAEICQKLAKHRELDATLFVSRIQRVNEKNASTKTPVVNDSTLKLAKEYVRYQVETLRTIKQSCTPVEFDNKLFLSIMFNVVQ